jgi:hypothetical protein
MLPATTQEESIVQSLLPWGRDDAKARYLSYRASGFTIREALKICECAHSTLSGWRKDPQFVQVEEHLPEIAQKVRAEYVSLEFVRNFRLVLEKDYKVLKTCLNMSDEPVTKSDLDYLLKMRTFYTPQQLQIVEALAKGELDGSSPLSWTDIVLSIRKTEEQTVRLRRIDAVPKLPQNDVEIQEHST